RRVERPGDCEVELRRAGGRLLALPRGDDPRDPVYPLLPVAQSEQVPDTCLEHEAERIEPPRHDTSPLEVTDADAPPMPEGRRDPRQMGRPVLLPEPAARVEVKESGGSSGALLQLGRKRREQLQPGRSELAAESELCRRPDEERLGLGGVEPGQPRPVTVL